MPQTQIINENAKNIPKNPVVPSDIPRSVPESRPRFPYSDQEGALTRVLDSNQEGEYINNSPIQQLSTQVPVSYPTKVIATAPHPGTFMRPHVITTAAAPAPTAKQLAARSNKFEDFSNDSKPVNCYQDIVAEFSNNS